MKIHCILCSSEILSDLNGEPYLLFKDKTICSNCSIDLIPVIFKGNDRGGIVKYIFKSCLSDSKKHRSSLSKKLFNKLLIQYNFKCLFCGSKKSLSIDHIQPVSKGGSNEYSNLQILCKSCNSRKGNKWTS
jgi:hypothetical protein